MPDWEYYLSRLINIRDKRNKLSHGEIPFDKAYAEQEDIDLVIHFREMIMTQTDPLALYAKAKRTSDKDPIPQWRGSPAKKTVQGRSTISSYPKRSSGCLSAVLCGLLIMVSIVILLLFL